jgi:hypothetical protein
MEAQMDRRTFRHLGLAVSVAVFLIASRGEGQSKACADQILAKCSGMPGPAPLVCVFNQTPSFSFPMMGLFATGMALADINGDGWDDLIVASWNDMAPQPLTVFYNTRKKKGGGIFPLYPSWYSDQIGYMGDLSVGDINGDGWMDVAVAVGMDTTRNTATGSVQVFFNRGGQLEPRASYRTGGGYLVAGCELGDVDADGDLDLVVPVVFEGIAQFPPPSNLVRPGRARIYLNEDGLLEPWPAWISADGIKAADAVAADINQDGWMDVAFAGTRTEIFYGRPPDGSSRVPIPTTPGWTSAETHQFSFGLDAGYDGLQADSIKAKVPSLQPLLLAVSSGCFGSFCSQPDPEAVSRFLLYRPDGGAGQESIWGSALAQAASKLLLADFNADGFLDLAAGQWGGVDMTGAATWLFQGRPDPEGRTIFNVKPDVATKTCTVGEGIAASDLRQMGVRSWCRDLEATEPVSVVTLPQRKILGIDRVRRSGRRLASFEYAWVPGSNWISLARPLEKGEKISVKYRISQVLDFVQGVWQPQLGSSVYLSALLPEESPGNCSD